MSDNALKYMIGTVIVLLVVSQIATLVSGLLGMAWGLVSAVVVGAVSFFSMRLARAGGQASLWFLLPTLLFTVLPVVMVVWNVFTAETSLLDRLAALLPFILSFALPMVLLALAYYELRKRTR